MKEKFKSLQKIILGELLLICFLFLYTKNYLDLLIYGIISIVLVVFISIIYLRTKEKRKYEVKCLNFLVSYVSLLNTYKNSMVAFENSKDQLDDLNFGYSYKEVQENEDLLDELKLGENLEYVKNSINGEVNYEACEEMVKKTNLRLEQIGEKNLSYETEKFLMSSVSLLAIFPLIRLIFGENLIDYKAMIFHVSSIAIYLLPLVLLLFKLMRGEKDEK